METTTLALQPTTSAKPEPALWRRTAYRARITPAPFNDSGTLTREAFEEQLVEEFKQSCRRATLIGVVFVDHSELCQTIPSFDASMTKLARQTTRSRDAVCSYALGQICILTTDSSVDGIPSLADRLREEFRNLAADAVARHSNSSDSPIETAPIVAAAICLPNRTTGAFERFLGVLGEAILSARQSGGVEFRSLLRPEDETTLREVQCRQFSHFLESGGFAPRESIQAAAELAKGPAYSIGRLARDLGWISRRRLARVLREQRRTRGMFGDTACRLGILSPQQIFSLLAIQRENPRELGDVLVREGAMEESAARTCLREYLRSPRLARAFRNT